MGSNKAKFLIILTIILIIGVFYVLTIREGHDWGDDFAVYIHHAKNIAEGIDYEDTGYIYNPLKPSLSPKMYPPIFPLLLLPVYKWFGLNLTAMKIEIILIFLLSLLIILLTFRNEVPFQYLAAIIIVIGFNPFFWDFKDNILSDIPFFFLTYLSLLFIHQAYQSYKSQRSKFIYAILIGLLIYLSCGTRSIGIVLIPCLLIYDIIRSKKPSRAAIVATLLFAFLMVLQTIFLHNDSSYFDQLAAINLKVILHHLFLYPGALSRLWDIGYGNISWIPLYVIIGALSVGGYLTRIKDKITIFEVFPILYLTIVIIWPASQGIRFLIPVIPLYILYAFVGINRIKFFQQKKIEKAVFIILICAIFVSYAIKYTKIDYAYIKDGIGKTETIEFFDYIRKNTKVDDVFIFVKPRVLSLFTGRSASGYHRPHDDKDLWRYFQKIGATYIIVGPMDNAFLPLFIIKYKDNFEKVYSNLDFKVYKIKYNLRPNGR